MAKLQLLCSALFGSATGCSQADDAVEICYINFINMLCTLLPHSHHYELGLLF